MHFITNFLKLFTKEERNSHNSWKRHEYLGDLGQTLFNQFELQSPCLQNRVWIVLLTRRTEQVGDRAQEAPFFGLDHH